MVAKILAAAGAERGDDRVDLSVTDGATNTVAATFTVESSP
jgi:hypothetical protein